MEMEAGCKGRKARAGRSLSGSKFQIVISAQPWLVATRITSTAAGLSGDGGLATTARLDQPRGVTLDSSGDIYIADTDNSGIRKVSKGVITMVAGNGTAGFSGDTGPATRSELEIPAGVAVDTASNVYIADLGSNRVRMVSNGAITTVAGTGAKSRYHTRNWPRRPCFRFPCT
jgi:hypothetical protein